MENFAGFPADMTEFMWDLRFNNNKEWFDLNRKRYEEFMKRPMDVFAKEMCEELKMMFGGEVYYNVSRVNRDIRFSRNKDPYRANKWVVFKLKQGRWQDMPCIYFDIGPDGWEMGCGFYSAKTDFMRAYRKKIDVETKRFEKIARDLKKYPDFIQYGDFYKKNMGDKEHKPYVMDWYMRKNVGVTLHCEPSEMIYSREIFDTVRENFKVLVPLAKFLNEVSV